MWPNMKLVDFRESARIIVQNTKQINNKCADREEILIENTQRVYEYYITYYEFTLQILRFENGIKFG